jgi:hypothetical protein
MDNVWIVVPVGAREKYLNELLDNLDEYAGRIIFINNSIGYTEFDGVVHIEDFGDINISRWWNTGINTAQKMGAEYVAVINDDISFDPSLISDMVYAMKKGDYEVSSAMGNLGVFWIIRASSSIRADENLRWWCGDGDIFRKAKIRGKLINIDTNKLNHLEHNLQTSESEFLKNLGNEDLKRYRAKLEKLGQLEHW